MPKTAIGLLLLCTAIHAALVQNLFDLETQEVKYRNQMLWQKDVETLQQILAGWNSRMGSDSLGATQYSPRLGTALMLTGDYSGAEQAIRTASILESNGPAYQDAALVKRKLVKALVEQGKTAEADQLKSTFLPVRPKVQTDTTPQILSKEEPQYTKAAAAKDVSGFISISMTVDEIGHPQDIHVIEPLGFGLDESAIKAVEKWRFKPATRSGAPVSSPLTVGVSFRHF